MIKSFTDISQSRKLAEILPIESADMYFWSSSKRYYIEAMDDGDFNEEEGHVRAWSLAALLGVMICPNLEEYIEGVWDLTAFTDNTLKTPIEIQDCKEPVDACVAMIEKLHELNLL